jgi:hypothetical protein
LLIFMDVSPTETLHRAPPETTGLFKPLRAPGVAPPQPLSGM